MTTSTFKHKFGAQKGPISLNQIKAQAKALDIECIYMHSSTYNRIVDVYTQARKNPWPLLLDIGSNRTFLNHFLLIEDDTLPETYFKYWEFREEPFVTYEPKDQEWCSYFGFGHQVPIPHWDIGNMILKMKTRSLEEGKDFLEDLRNYIR